MYTYSIQNLISQSEHGLVLCRNHWYKKRRWFCYYRCSDRQQKWQHAIRRRTIRMKAKAPKTAKMIIQSSSSFPSVCGAAVARSRITRQGRKNMSWFNMVFQTWDHIICSWYRYQGLLWNYTFASNYNNT